MPVCHIVMYVSNAYKPSYVHVHIFVFLYLYLLAVPRINFRNGKLMRQEDHCNV